ncbi:MAG: hypothetical protein M1817_004139 [Caeruleum heppii]|nr:MAG: hypothetical protein M1817_004139 [Caeruleum heppii]
MPGQILVPSPYWHREPLEFASCCCMTQAEYDRVPQPSLITDELITVRAPTSTSFMGFVEQRSILARAPTLAAFFESEHYLAGTKAALWLLDTHAVVVKLALAYLFHGDQYDPPSLDDHTISEQIFVTINLYFFAKRLQLPQLEDIAFQMLRVNQDGVTAKDVIVMAQVIYKHPTEKDHRIRGFLQRRVELHLRHLLNDDEWRHLLRDSRPSLAADMFELTAIILLEGAASAYPPTLPARTPDDPHALECDEELHAIAIRHHTPTHPKGLTVARGERLRSCMIAGSDVVGTSARGDRGFVPRDHVELTVEVERRRRRRRPSPTADDPDDGDGRSSGRSPETVGVAGMGSRRDKASWVLGMDSVTDVFVETPRSATGRVKTPRARLEKTLKSTFHKT